MGGNAHAPPAPSLWPAGSDAYMTDIQYLPDGHYCGGSPFPGNPYPGTGCRGCNAVPYCSAGEPSNPNDASYCPNASTVPGSHFAYKVRYNDTLDHLDDRFGFAHGTLCNFNGIKNCSC